VGALPPTQNDCLTIASQKHGKEYNRLQGVAVEAQGRGDTAAALAAMSKAVALVRYTLRPHPPSLLVRVTSGVGVLWIWGDADSPSHTGTRPQGPQPWYTTAVPRYGPPLLHPRVTGVCVLGHRHTPCGGRGVVCACVCASDALLCDRTCLRLTPPFIRLPP
jgi:hypothetical protein